MTQGDNHRAAFLQMEVIFAPLGLSAKIANELWPGVGYDSRDDVRDHILGIL